MITYDDDLRSRAAMDALLALARRLSGTSPTYWALGWLQAWIAADPGRLADFEATVRHDTVHHDTRGWGAEGNPLGVK